MTTITRRYHFSASHRLHSPELSSAENARIFGKCNNPYGHGHDYTLEVTVSGEPERATGLIVSLAALDRLVNEKALAAFAWRNINLDVPQFQKLIATTENVALVITDLLQQHWIEYLGDTSALLSRIFIQETERNGFEVLVRSSRPARNQSTVETLVHA